MTQKKIVALGICITALLLGACSNNGDESNTANHKTTSQEQKEAGKKVDGKNAVKENKKAEAEKTGTTQEAAEEQANSEEVPPAAKEEQPKEVEKPSFVEYKNGLVKMFTSTANGMSKTDLARMDKYANCFAEKTYKDISANYAAFVASGNAELLNSPIPEADKPIFDAGLKACTPTISSY